MADGFHIKSILKKIMDNYQKIVQNNLNRLYKALPGDLSDRLPAQQKGNLFSFRAFGEDCTLAPDNISLSGKQAPSVTGILISLYALHAGTEICIETPLTAFKEFSGSMPYAGAFTTHTEQVLVPFLTKIKNNMEKIYCAFGGKASLSGTSGDFSFMVYPLPKVALGYIFYEADEDFPASVTCLFSNNANQFMPVDGLADVGEYTSKKIISLIEK
ncbi:MAG: DUF3786 domain-containing protein [Desulfobacteraceae bacterium]